MDTATRSIIDKMAQLIAAEPDKAGIYKQALRLGRECIHKHFAVDTPPALLLLLRTRIVDYVLQQLWLKRQQDFSGLALVAVGGYGRGELHPHSDIDIAILLPESYESSKNTKTDETLSTWITALWDLNLDIGHSVRTVADCKREAAADITVITNLMEGRFLCGSETLFHEMQETIKPERMWTSAEFYAAKLGEQEQRISRFQTNAYRLEPNIKESQGGLRDFQTISWVCQRHFGTQSLEPLIDAGLLESEELDSLRSGLDLLWRIRYMLHELADRREDRLLFDYQKEIAHFFGYTDDSDNRSIEMLMQRFYRTVMSLQRLNEIVLQGVGGLISGVTEASEIIPISSRFQLRNGFLEVTHDEVFVHYPAAMLELFLVFGNTEAALKVRSHTVRLVRKNLPLINDRFRSDPVARKLFVQIFSMPNKLTRTVRLMNRYGVMAAYIPAFDKIVGRMQYDLFHIYTVDEHTIKVIRNLRRMAVPRFAEEMPHGSKVSSTIERPEILYLTALFHDIAKGRGGDHSELGAVDAHNFAVSHGLSSTDADLLVWTVRNHLIMSITAQRKDIDDPYEQLEFAKKVGSIERLNHLYLLTISDIRATNPELWTSFKRSLIQSLYRHTIQILERGLDNPLGVSDVINRRQAQTRNLIADTLKTDPRVEKLWNSLGEDYFKQYQAIEIARHTEILLANEDTPGPLVALRYSASRGSTEILIYTPDDEALFALITAVLERLQLNVLTATINTTAGGFAIDTFHVLDSTNMPIEDSDRVDEVRQILTYELGVPKNIPALNAQRPSRRLRNFSISTKIEFTADESGFTELRITTTDQPGALSDIGKALMDSGYNVHAARISTLGERIDNIFLLSNCAGALLTKNEQGKVRHLIEVAL